MASLRHVTLTSARGRRLLRACALAVLLAATLAPLGRATTAPAVVVKIRVTLTDTGVVLSPGRAPRGDFARFLIRNTGTKPHTFILGKARRGSGRQSGFSRTLAPRAHASLYLFLDYRGRLPYFSRVASGGAKPATEGFFEIT